MRNPQTIRKLVVAVVFGGFLSAMLLNGCTSGTNAPPAQSLSPTTQPVAFALFGPPPHKSGVQLWSDNCMRCHNGRPPETFSDAQWEVIVHHMRLRANLTGEEAREVTKFLQASN